MASDELFKDRGSQSMTAADSMPGIERTLSSSRRWNSRPRASLYPWMLRSNEAVTAPFGL
jgi:hypothetical protein